jgi:hypothetical protein
MENAISQKTTNKKTPKAGLAFGVRWFLHAGTMRTLRPTLKERQ